MSTPLQTEETVHISAATISCDGDKASAHPRVFLTVNAKGFVDCPYCGKHYVLEEGALSSGSHQ